MSTIHSNLNNGILTLTFNRPERLNALRKVDFINLLKQLKAFRDDDDAKVLILTGNGRGFCSGEDLGEVEFFEKTDPSGPRAQIELLQDISKLLYGLNKPTIAAINGPAVGFGLEVTLSFDIRVASTKAWFWFSEATRGLLPTNGAFYLLPRIIGVGRATRMMLAAEKMMAEEASLSGLISGIYEPNELLPEATRLAKSISGNTVESTTRIKQLLRQSYSLGMGELMALEVEGSMELFEMGKSAKGAQDFRSSKALS